MHEPVRGSELPAVPALAYLGDAEYTVHVRRMLIERGVERAGELNRLSLLYVTAERQAAAMRCLEPQLSEDEHDVFRRAKNSTHLNRPKHASPMDYRYATGFEAVLGMLSYIGDRERLLKLMRAATDMPPDTEETNRKDTTI
ncbi:MAG: Mini-ribonuclease 3 [Clostridia bacterium]|nr:Mini-ribonuclease 3 [Clostridia bacterium]